MTILPLISVLAVVWLVVIGWVANDAARRRRSWLGWALLVGNTNILGLVLWLVVRRRSPALAAQPGPLRSAALWLAAVPVVLLSVLIALYVASSVFQATRVEGLAMAPTLNNQDRLFVNQFAYWFGAPQRGDIVMFAYPPSPDKLFVKRIIAREGDTIRSVDGRVFVNDVELVEDYVPREYRSHDDWGPQVIQQGYFVMGDHRNNSADSRTWGLVPTDNMLGKVALRWWPIGAATIF